jgi:MutS domain V
MRAEYEGRLRELESSSARSRSEHLAAGAILALIGVVILLMAPFARQQHFLAGWLALLIPIGVAGVRRFRRYQAAQSRTWRLKLFYARGVQRVTGEWAGKGFDGAEFQDPGHAYARELGVFGEGSLFELMCHARTAIGRRSLAGYLRSPAPVEEVRLRQQAAAELEPQVELREEVAVLGEYESAESSWETFAAWLDSPLVSFPKWLRWASALSSVLLVGIVLATLMTAGPGVLAWVKMAAWVWPLLLFHATVGVVYRRRVNGMLESVRALSVETRVVREGLQLLESSRFQSAKLAQLSVRVRHGARLVRRLERLLGALSQRNKDGFYFLSRALLAGTQGCMALEEWRRKYGAELRGWLDSWGEFEALNALGSYAHENRDHTFPEFSAEGACFEAIGLGHPLLPDEVCVRNDVRLNRATRFYMISGSNMSGKSTLLRAIGLNAVLAFAGAPVRARGLRISGLSVCASIAVVDSLLNGKSKFLAEVDRLRDAIEAAGKGPLLFLVDEIFSGTNSRDRRTAAEAVVRTLIERGAIGALSTHDMALTEIAEAAGLAGENVHMGSKEGGGPMDFDYLLKPGVTTETNALEIARMAGVPV